MSDKGKISDEKGTEWGLLDEQGIVSGQSEMVDWMAVNYPETFEFFQNILLQELDLFCSKQHDYGPQNIALGQSLITRDERDFAVLGVMIRTLDKVNRMMTLLRSKSEPNHESIEDTLMDISVYANIALAVHRDVWGK